MIRITIKSCAIFDENFIIKEKIILHGKIRSITRFVMLFCPSLPITLVFFKINPIIIRANIINCKFTNSFTLVYLRFSV